MAHCSMMERNTNTPYNLHLSQFQDYFGVLHMPSTQVPRLISQYQKMEKNEWRQRLRAYDSDDKYIYILVFYGIQEFFIKTINRRDLYEELSREKLRQPYLLLIAVHHIMTGPERYTDDQLLPILEPLNKSDLQGRWVCGAVREMFEDNTPEEAYDIIHSVYGRFPDIMDSLLLAYSIVLLKGKLSTICNIPTEREMKDVATLVKAVVVGIGKANKNFLGKLCNNIMYDEFEWIFLAIYHELFTLHHSLPRVDTLLHYMQRRIMAEDNRAWWNNETASAYIVAYFDLEEKSPVQCLSSIKEMFCFSPSLLCIIEQTFVRSHKYLMKEMLLTLFNNNIYIQEDVFALLPQDDLVNILAWTKKHKFNCKERDVAMLILQLNMTILEDTLKENLTSSIAAYLHISSNTGHDDIIYQCYCCVRHHNKKNHVDDDAIHEYQEQFPFIAAMEIKEKMKRLARLITIVVLLILLLISSALGLTSSQLKKYLSLKYEYEDAILYLLWCSGDVEINPGPTLKKLTRVPDSQKERSWIYDLSSVVLKTIQGHDLEVKTDGLWKEPPKNWDTRQPFYDPRNKPKGYNLTSKDDILLLDNLIHSCEQTEKQIPHLFHGEVTLWRNGNKQELFQHYLLRTEKNVITEATKVLCLYSDDNSLKDQLQEKKIGLIRNQTGTNKTIKKPKNYLDVVRDIATTLCRLSKRLPITEKSDGIWKTPPLGWNPKDEYFSPCNAGKRTETHQDKQLVDNLINCCERQKTEIPSELQHIVKAWKGGNREEITKEYTIWANVCLIHHSLEYLKVEGLLGKPQVQQLLQELGISRSTDTTTENQSTQNNKPTLKKRKRKATLAVDEGTKKKSAISNTVTALPACDEDHETSCDPTTTDSSDKSNDDEVAHGLPANTTECSGTTRDSSSISVVDTSTESSDVAMGSGLATTKTNALVAVATSLQDVDTSNLSTDGEDPEEIKMEIEKHNLSRDFELDPDIDKYLTQENSENIQFDPLLFDNLVNSVNAN